MWWLGLTGGIKATAHNGRQGFETRDSENFVGIMFYGWTIYNVNR